MYGLNCFKNLKDGANESRHACLTCILEATVAGAKASLIIINLSLSSLPHILRHSMLASNSGCSQGCSWTSNPFVHLPSAKITDAYNTLIYTVFEIKPCVPCLLEITLPTKATHTPLMPYFKGGKLLKTYISYLLWWSND